MVRHLIVAMLAFTLASCASAPNDARTPGALPIRIGPEVPRTAVPFFDEPEAFRFAIIGDRTGGHRPGVFEDALGKLNLMKPEFVISVGDQIEGYTDDPARIDQQWNEFESFMGKLDMPFFFVAGNHDISNPLMADVWARRRGASYYHFVYKNVLFLVLNTEDPPVQFDSGTLASTRRMEEAMARAPEETQRSLLEAVRGRPASPKLPGAVAISDSQIGYVEKVLAENTDVRWTMVFMHKPAWAYSSPAFARIEKMLRNRSYTVIAGHEHYYAYDSRYGRDYIDMGTTGGIWLRDGPGRPDHIVWVTMTRDGPQFAVILTEAISGKKGPTAIPAE
jgi:serine/threonine-protein phosphatase CPPED1